MKILLLSWRGPGHPHAGGAEIVTHEYAKAWVNAGHEVTLFTSSFPEAKEQEEIDGVKIIRKGNQILSVQWQAFWWYLFQNNQRFDLVIDQFHGLPFFTPLFVRTKKIAFIHEVTKDIWQYNPLKEPFHSFVAFIGMKGEPLVFKLLYSKLPFLTVSPSTKRELVLYGIPEKNISVIYNGVKTVKVANIRKKKVVTFIGAISHDKGIEDALKVFHLLKDLKLQFWVIGKHSDDYFLKIKQLVRDLGLEQPVKFWGYVSERKKFELLAQSLIIVNPSVKEGWGLTVIEAASVKTPTVAYNVTGLQDAIIHNKTGLLSGENTPEALARMIKKLLLNKKKYQKLQRAGEMWAQRFDWKIAVRKSFQLLDKITEGSIAS